MSINALDVWHCTMNKSHFQFIIELRMNSPYTNHNAAYILPPNPAKGLWLDGFLSRCKHPYNFIH